MAKLKHLKYNLTVLVTSILFFGIISIVQAQDIPSDSTINSDTTSFVNSKDTSISVTEVTKGDIETTILYEARDSISFDVKKQEVTLHGDAKVTYGEMEIDADLITINYNTGQINAIYTLDSTGRKIGIPHFKDNEDEFYIEKMGYNYITERGTLSAGLTQQGEGWMRWEESTKTKDDILYLKNGEFCPCEDSTATTYIRSNKIKIIPDKRIVTGPAVLYVGDVPTPLVMPFGLFPATGQRSSGVIIPRRFGETEARGFYLADGGYYWAVNDYVGIEFLGEAYSNGGWGLGSKATYKDRYKFDGFADINYRKVISNGGQSNETDERDVKFTWRHTPKIRGGKKFSADVNIASTDYNRNNEIASSSYLQNSMNSNISYFTPLGRNSPFSLSMKLRHSQNNLDSTVEFTLPDMSLNMSRRLPFQYYKKGKRNMMNDFIRSTGIAYTMKFQNKLDNSNDATSFPFNTGASTSDESKNYDLTEMWNNAEYGMQHNIPISASMKLGNSLTFNPSFNYTENWYPEKNIYEYNNTDSLVDVTREDGFHRASWYSATASLNTSYYLTYGFKGAKEPKLRQIIRPTISGRFSPDFTDPNTNGSAYTSIKTDTSDSRTDVSQFQGMTYNYGGGQKQATLGFSLQNNFELKKLKTFSDTVDVNQLSAKDRYKYIKLLDNLTLSGNYNFAADSFALSRFNVIASTKLFNLFNIQGRAVIDPYTYSSEDSTRQNIYAWDVGEGIGSMESSSLSIGSTFSDKIFQNKNDNRIQDEKENDLFVYSPYVDFTVPWSLTLNYNITYNKYGFTPSRTFQSLSFRGTLALTEKWQVAYSGAYDFENKNIVTPRLVISRDLSCWIMNFNWVPFGPQKSYNFELHVKASVLKDLNLRRGNNYYDQAR